MIDKSLVKKRFKRSLKTYNDNAFAQKQMAEKLVNMLPSKSFKSVFEIGCASGILTSEIKKHINFESFTANDLVEESKNYINKIIPVNTFISGDIEELCFEEKYDLIISNACLQWCGNIEKTILKLYDLLEDKGILAVSIFGDENLKEIKNLFNIENKMYTMPELKQFLFGFSDTVIKEDSLKQTFDSPLDVLKHLKLTGVNAVKELKLTKTILKQFEADYIKSYSINNKVILTYNPVYILIKKCK